jgi:Protein of unknown function (DUF4446)
MTLHEDTQTLLILIGIGLDVLLLLAVIILAARRRPGRSARPVAMDDALKGMLDGQTQAFRRLEQAIRQLYDGQERLGQTMRGAVQRVGLVRYDAFEDVGGRLSFSCAMLNEEGDGVLVTSINGRQDTRVYAKPVHRGESMHNLSTEEAAAVREAMLGPQKVEAR